MKFSAVTVLAAAAGVQAVYSNVTVTTEVVTAYTTYCPAPTTLTHGHKTYTITEATTLTITDCPCTITKPVTTVSSVVCNTCTSHANTTVATTTKSTPAGTGAATTTKATTLPTAGAGKVAALSGAGLAGVLGLAAFIL